MKFFTLLFLGLAFSVSTYAQADDRAVVYVYQPHHVRTLGRVAPPIFIDEHEVAKLDGQRYFIARLKPGVHSFRSKDKNKGGVEFELKPGGVYYVRMELEEGVTLHGAHMAHVADEEGAYSVRQMKPIKLEDIKDKSIVETSYPPFHK